MVIARLREPPVAFRSEGDARVVPNRAGGAPGVSHRGKASASAQVRADTGDGNREAQRAASGFAQVVARKARVLVVHIQRVAVAGAETCAVSDVQRLRVWSPGCSVAHAAKSLLDPGGSTVKIKDLAHLIVDENCVVVRCNRQHDTRGIRVLFGELIADTAVDHQLMT